MNDRDFASLSAVINYNSMVESIHCIKFLHFHIFLKTLENNVIRCISTRGFRIWSQNYRQITSDPVFGRKTFKLRLDRGMHIFSRFFSRRDASDSIIFKYLKKNLIFGLIMGYNGGKKWGAFFLHHFVTSKKSLYIMS